MFDYHIHSQYSIDGRMSMEEACIKAIDIGLKEIAFTDHIDLDWPDDIFPPFDINSVEKYIEDIEQLQQKFQTLLTIRKGAEIGLQPHTLEQYSKIVSSHAFDFVIASVHIVGRADPSLPMFFENRTKQESYIRYYEEILSLIESFDQFSVLGHIDYIKRYSPFPYEENDHMIGIDIIEEILRVLIRNGKGLEVNTSGYRHTSNCPMPHFDIIRRYHQLGGQIITLGSDAHATRYIGLNFDKALKNIHSAGFMGLTAFTNQRPQLFVT